MTTSCFLSAKNSRLEIQLANSIHDDNNNSNNNLTLTDSSKNKNGLLEAGLSLEALLRARLKQQTIEVLQPLSLPFFYTSVRLAWPNTQRALIAVRIQVAEQQAVGNAIGFDFDFGTEFSLSLTISAIPGQSCRNSKLVRWNFVLRV